jgi:hypothetical protein
MTLKILEVLTKKEIEENKNCGIKNFQNSINLNKSGLKSANIN